MTEFADRLLEWFDRHGRKDLPWQKDVSPYRVWVSEIMLQQTQVQTVIPYFERFVKSFPSIEVLATAKQDDVLRHWSGLGYYARARNLHKAAQIVQEEFDGVFPTDLDAVTALPGIGRSTAGAILSIALAQRQPILDGNVKRVLSRHDTIAGWPGTTNVAKKLWAAAELYTPEERVADYTQAIMDLGATVCARSNPECSRCPVSASCSALAADTVSDYPGRKVAKTKPVRATTMILASLGGRVYLERRPESGIWGGLWSLPELGERSIEEWCSEKLMGCTGTPEPWTILRHSFSHYDLDIQPLVVRCDTEPSTVADTDSALWHELGAALPGGIAAPVKKLIEQLKKNEHVSDH